MQIRFGIVAVGTALIGIVLTAASYAAESLEESSWQSLTDEPSRQILFQELIKKDVEIPTIESFALPKLFVFPDDARWDSIEKHSRNNSIFGLDVSHYTDPDIRFDLLSQQNVSFVYVKATQGLKYKDDKFHVFWAKLGALGANVKVRRGAYHFLSSSAPGSAQADSFIGYVKLQGGFNSDDLPPVVDLEWDRTSTNPDEWIGRGADYIVKNALDCLARIKELTGRTPILYTATSWWTTKTVPIERLDEFRDYPLWIADYNPKRKLSEHPAVPSGVTPALWQFADDSTLTLGYKGPIDTSVFYGSEDDFERAFGPSK